LRKRRPGRGDALDAEALVVEEVMEETRIVRLALWWSYYLGLAIIGGVIFCHWKVVMNVTAWNVSRLYVYNRYPGNVG
jgi:hypothetical protein